MDQQPLLKISNLTVTLNHQIILDNVNFEVYKNDTVAVIGPNGAGKTTLFRALLGLVPYEGKITWQKGVKIGYVPQRLYINRDLPLTTKEFFDLKGKFSHQEILEALQAVGFAENEPHEGHLQKHILNRKIGVLSGGELQRILIAWALLGNPDLLLFDEPTAGIDVSAEETIYSLLEKLKKKQGLTIILISHELEIVYRFANNVICLNKKQVCSGPPREILDKEGLAKLFGGNVGLYQHH